VVGAVIDGQADQLAIAGQWLVLVVEMGEQLYGAAFSCAGGFRGWSIPRSRHRAEWCRIFARPWTGNRGRNRFRSSPPRRLVCRRHKYQSWGLLSGA